MMAVLYVGDLHPDVTEGMLLEKFSPAGLLYSVRLCRDKNMGSSLKYAYVNFQKRADAERALEMLNFDLLLGRPMRIMWSQRDSSLRNTGIGNIFIKNLDESIDSRALYDTFSTFGKILSCKVVGYATGSKGYGYIHFESADAADRAIERLNGKLFNDRKVFIEHFKSRNERQAEMGTRPCVQAVEEMNMKEMNGTRIYVGEAQNKAERQAELKQKYEQGLNLYVKNLDASVDDECLRKEFSRFGTIINAKVMMENGCSKGFGFVQFASSGDAMNAIKGMKGRMWGRKPLYVGVFKSKDERLAYNAQQQAQTMASMQAQNVAAYYASSQMVPPLANPYSYWTVDPQYVQTMPDAAQNPMIPMMQQQSYVVSPPVSTEEQCTYILCTYTTAPTAADTIPVANAVPAADVAIDAMAAVGAVEAVEPAPAVDKSLKPAAPEVPSLAPAVVEVPGPAPNEDAGPEPAATYVPSQGPASVEVSGPASVVGEHPEPAVPDVPCTTPAAGEAPAPGDPSKPSEFDVATKPLPRKRLTIYMLESSPVDEQVQMAYDYMLPLVEEIHPTLARKITWMLLEGENNHNIMNMIGNPVLLHAKVDEMDALLKAREAGHNPETLKMYNINNNNKKRKNKRKKEINLAVNIAINK